MALQELEIKWDALEILDLDEFISLFFTLDGDELEVSWDDLVLAELDFLWILIIRKISQIFVAELDESGVIWDSSVS